MAFLLKLLLCLVLIAACVYETRSCIINFNKVKGSVFSFLGAFAWAAVAWLWVYLAGVVVYTGTFAGTDYFNLIAAGCVLAGFVSACLACYVDFYKDMPKGPTR